MTKISASILGCCLSLNAMAFALPGDKNIETWARHHPFLGSQVAGSSQHLGSCRQTKEHREICWRSIDNRFNQIESIWIMDSSHNSLPVWQRNNSVAKDVLKLIYGSPMVADFSQATLVFQIEEYDSNFTQFTDEEAESEVRKKMPTTASKYILDKGKVLFYRGKHYGYEVSKDRLILMQPETLWKNIDILKHNKAVRDKAFNQLK